MGSGVTNFLSIVEARSLGTADIDKMAAAIDKQTAALDGLGKKATAIDSHPGFSNFASKVKQGITDPLGAVETAIESAASKFGILGQVVGGTILTIGALGAAGFSAAKSLAAYGQEIENVGLRTGLTTKEVAQFGFAAKLVDQDVTVFERAMRGLTEALTDNSAAGAKAREALQRLGVVPRDLNGELKPTGQLLTELSDGLNKLPNALERNRVGMDIFKRAWIEIGPSILKLNEGVKIANEQGLFGPSKAELEKWDDYDKKVTVAEAKLDRFFRKAKQFAAESLYPDQDLVELRRQKDAAERGAPYNVPLDVLQGLPQSRTGLGYRFTTGAGAVESLFAADRASGNALLGSARSGMSRTLEGLRFTAEQAKQKYEDAYRAIQTLSDVGAEAAQKEIDKVAALKKTYESLNEQLKLAEKNEAARLAVLEKAQALRQQGMPFYQFGEGNNAFFVTGQQITDANTKPISSAFPPSLFRAGNSPTGAIIGSPSVPLGGLSAGIQPNGDFVSPEAARTTGYTSIEALNALWSGFSQKVKTDEQATLSIMMSQSETLGRLIELRAGPGGEIAAAIQVASLREKALRQELEQTHDIAKYREESKRNELDLTLRIAEEDRRRTEELRSEMGGLFDALLGGKSGIQQFAAGQLRTLGRAAFSNIATSVFRTGDKLNGGSIFGGTWLGDALGGNNPLKASTDANTLATMANTAALRSISMSASGGGGGLVSSAAGTFARIAGGGFGGGGPVEYSEDGVPIGRWEPHGVNGDYAGESAHPAGLGFGRVAGLGAAAIGTGFGVYSGIRQGGGAGALMAGGSALAGAGAIISLASSKLAAVAGPAGALAGLVLGSILPSLMPDHRKERADFLERERMARAYTMPSGADYSVDIYGRSFDYDYRGTPRSVTNVYISATDTESVKAHFERNADAIVTTVAGRIVDGNAEELVGHIGRRLGYKG